MAGQEVSHSRFCCYDDPSEHFILPLNSLGRGVRCGSCRWLRLTEYGFQNIRDLNDLVVSEIKRSNCSGSETEATRVPRPHLVKRKSVAIQGQTTTTKYGLGLHSRQTE